MKKLKKQSIVIKLIENTRVLFFENFLIINGPKGMLAYPKNKGKYTIILKEHFFVILLEIENLNEKSKLSNLVKNLIFGVHFFFSKKLVLVGIGLRSWIKAFKNNKKVLLIKVGFSEDLSIVIPKAILVFSLRPTILLIRGLNKEKVNQFSSFIRLCKKPEKYKGIGIQYQNEVLLLKPGKKN